MKATWWSSMAPLIVRGKTDLSIIVAGPMLALLLTPFIRPRLEKCTLKWRSVAINGYHTHIVHRVRIKLCYLSGRNMWRQNFPDRKAAVAALRSHNKKAYATVEPMVDIHPPQLQAIGGFVFKCNIPSSKKGCWESNTLNDFLLWSVLVPQMIVMKSSYM